MTQILTPERATGRVPGLGAAALGASTLAAAVATTGAYDSYYSYDAAGRQTKLVGPLAQSANPDDSKLVWTTNYDAAGNTVKATDPDTGTTTSSYNDDNELVSSTDNAGQTLSTDYDVLGRKMAVHNGDTSGPVINSWAYDTADGGKGKLAAATTYATDGTTPTWTQSIKGYNAFDKPTGETTYNPAGQITSATGTQDGGGAASTDRQCFDYDYLGRLTNAWTDAGTTHTAPTPSVQGIGGCDTTDPSTASLSGPAPYWQSYSYDLTGNRIASTDHSTTPGGSDRTTTETYDGLDTQHAVHTVTTGNTTTSWDYDADGRPTGTTTTTGGTVNPDTGQAFTWNPAGKLATLTTGTPDQPTHSTGYGYDTDGNLIARTVDGTTTLYLGGDAIHLSSGSATEIDRTYSFPDGPSAVRVATAAGSSLHWQAADPHGTGTVDITADGLTVTRRRYTPFGQDRTPTSSQDWAGDKGFVGGTRDDTNQLTNLGARQYSPALGRFLNPDPLLDSASPQQWNGYAYANNMPINALDSSGKILACGGLGGSDPGMGCMGLDARSSNQADRKHGWSS
jgi:RHS repeat-associated protein